LSTYRLLGELEWLKPVSFCRFLELKKSFIFRVEKGGLFLFKEKEKAEGVYQIISGSI
jgi:hypothetical protein